MYEIALDILKKLEDNNFEAYIVGGYPRDKYLNRKSTDIDICTNALVTDIDRLFDNVDLKNKMYGNAIIKVNEYSFDVTTFRSEKYLKNRNDMEIKFIDSLEEDLKRRDFTINTLCINSSGEYIDIFDSKKDLDNKIIKLIGNEERLKDDPLRILRALRFSSNLNFKIDAYLEDGINKYSYLIDTLGENRIKKELNEFNDISILKKYNLDKYIEK